MQESPAASAKLEKEIIERTTEATPRCIEFLRDLIALPSPSRGERLACERVVREMEGLGYQDVRIDDMGNVLGRFGDGPRHIAFDAHIDTVGISRPANWRLDPFRGQVIGGTMHGRGASDQKGGLASIIQGIAQAAAVGLPEDLTIWVTGTVNGEDCVGLAWQHLVGVEELRPEVVVIAMPSHLGICRGQRGRLEIKIATEGVATHGSHPELGENAVSAMAPIIQAITNLHGQFAGGHPLLGPGSIAVTEVTSQSPSFTAIPDWCQIHVDRRCTVGESAEEALEQLRNLPAIQAAGASVGLLEYDLPSWRGLVRRTDKVFPAWETPEDSPAFRTALESARRVLGREPRLHRSAFSSHGCTITGQFDIPTIGFGPADESHSHTVDDQIPLAQLQPAMAFYALFPFLFNGMK